MRNSKPHVAILGTRGIPASYGGFETFAEELSTRMVKRGYQVTVYGRRSFGEKTPELSEYRDVNLRYAPTIKQKYLETPLHSLFSFLDLFRYKVDCVLLCNAANSPFAWLVRVKGIPLYINVDGVERKRKKWNCLGRLWYLLGEWCSVRFATKVVADAEVIAEYYRDTYKNEPAVISYGASKLEAAESKTLTEFGLQARSYILYVSRLEPENNALCVVEAYAKLETELPLVIVGDAPYADSYKQRLRDAANENVIFTGFQFGDSYVELRSNCFSYVQATEVGGTHPALVEAMAYGNSIVANDVPEHREVLGDAGLYYEFNNPDSLAEQLKVLLGSNETVEQLGKRAEARARELYCWDRVVEQYEALFDIRPS